MSGEPGASRRALLGGATAVLAGAALGGCGHSHIGSDSVHHAKRTVRRSDVAILRALLDLERRTVAAYTAGLPLLSKPEAKAYRQFLNEELQHTGELISLIKAGGAKAHPNAGAWDLGAPPAGPGQVFALWHELERLQIAAYLQAIPRLAPGPVRAAVTTIMASDAQHIVVLRGARGLEPMPSAILSADE